MPSKKQAYLYFRKENTMNEELFNKMIGEIFSKPEAKITIHWKDTVSDKPSTLKADSMEDKGALLIIRYGEASAIVPKDNVKFIIVEKG